MNVTNPEVVISGLGPTGLVLAHMLGMRGHRVVVLEREPKFYGNARAVYTDDECMRVFQHIDAAAALQEKMLMETPVQFVRPDGGVMGQYVPLGRPFGWPVINFFYQPYLETTLTELLAARYPNVEVRRGRELMSFEQDADGVSVTHRATQACRFGDLTDQQVQRSAEDDDVRTLRAKYLIGADGGRSRVREQLGIKMTGKNFPERWLVVDLQQKDPAEGLRHIPYFSFIVDPEMPAVSCVQPDGFHRFEFMMMDGQTKEWLEQDDTVHMLLSKYVDPDKFEIKRKLVYTFNALMADTWRNGRVLLAGDAAHMTPQFMGQGASSGVRDAFNLGWKLSAVLRGQGGDALLDSYYAERRDHAQAMIDVSVMMKNVVSMTHPVATALRDLLFKIGLSTPILREYLQSGGWKPSPVYTRGAYLGLPRRRRKGPEGAMSPQPAVRRIDGTRVRLDDLLGTQYALIGLDVDPRQELSAESFRFLERVGATFLTLYRYGRRPQGHRDVPCRAPEGLVEIEDIEGGMIEWFEKAGHRTGAVAIIRPDKFTFGIVPALRVDQALHALRRLIGFAPIACAPTAGVGHALAA